MNRANFLRGVVLVLVAGFFAYRYWQADSLYYLICLIGFGAVGLLSFTEWVTSRWQNIALNLGISLFFLDFVFAEIDLREVGTAIARADYVMFGLSCLLVLVHLYFRTLRWQWLLKPLGEVGFWPAFRGLVIGITGNVVLPARLGEFLRAYVIGRSTGVSKTGAFATLVVERIFDGITVLLLLLAVIILGFRDEQLQAAGIAGAVLFVGALVGVVLFMWQRQWADQIVHRLLPERFAEPLLAILDGFGSGLASLKNPQQMAMVNLWNIGTWAVIPFSFWFALQSLDFGTPIPWQTAALMLPALALALSIPGTPGGVGPVQAAVVYTITVTFPESAGGPQFQAAVAAAAILVHASQILPEVIPGIISFFIEGLSGKDIEAGRNLAEAEAA